jgi:hypothetical protein
MEAYLIEARSIGGLSGSPVFVNLGVVRETPDRPPFTLGRVAVYLLGLVHGHWDVESGLIGEANVNMGIAIVTPIQKAAEMIEDDVDAFRKSLLGP